ncbi:MAG: hypothetical protein AAF639_43995, partial [Chloroflexota bacterium]
MTYLAVDDLDAAVERAKELGGKIEIEETNALGKVALIRDPAGAGFTAYEGKQESSYSPWGPAGRWVWAELFVWDLSVVKPFYEGVFGWMFEPERGSPDRYEIVGDGGKRIGSVQVADNSV